MGNLRKVFEDLPWKSKTEGSVDLSDADKIYTEEDWGKSQKELIKDERRNFKTLEPCFLW